MKKLIFSFVIILFAGGIFAQSNSANEQTAQTVSEMLAKKYNLDQNETTQVYDIYLDQQNKIAAASSLKESNPEAFDAKVTKIEADANTALTKAIGTKIEAHRTKMAAKKATQQKKLSLQSKEQ